MKAFLQKIHNYFQPVELNSKPASPAEYILGSVILLTLGIYLFHPLSRYMDIEFADEAAYMRFGLDLFGHLNRDWGPVYAIWYKLLSYITSDPIQLYYLNYKIPAIVVPLLFFIFFLRLRIHSWLALFVSVCFLYSNMNVTVWPRISNFCMLIFLSSLIVITFQQKYLHRFITMLLCCLICSYARPEFYLSFVVTTLLLAGYLVFNRTSITKKDWSILFTVIIIVGGLHYIFRFPSNNFFGYNRGVAAFYQHYAYNYKVRTKATGIAWLFWEDLAKKTFGDCNSMWCVIKTQPMIVFKNTIYNIQNYVLFTWVYVSSFIIPSFLARNTKKALLASVLLAVLFVYCLAQKERRKNIGLYIRHHILLFIFLVIYCLPTFASCIIVYPRTHYILLQAGFTMTLLVIVLNSLFTKNKLSLLFMAALLPIFILLPSSLKNYSFLHTEGETSTNFCNTQIIRTLRNNYTGKPYTLFTPMPFVVGMLPDNFSEVNTVFDKKEDSAFSGYLLKRNINIVLITPAIYKDPHLLNDSTWIQFMRDPAAQGFIKKPLCGDTHYLLVKEN